MSDWSSIQQRGMKLRQKRMLLESQHQAVEEQRRRNVGLSISAQERIQAGDFVKEILERLQHREHERAVGAYEQLLGAFLSDVLPGERQIVMDLHTDRSAPALDIYIKKGENMPLEDAWLGTGGSVTNLLSTGLRLVALLRSGQRRFLVLDESDCWIKPALIPQYASIVAQMASELGVQVLMISHHDESLFSQSIPHRLRLSRLKSGLLTSEWSPTSDIPQWEDAQTGLRSIGLKDFQSHQNTFIPLAAGVTLLQGDNDIGKSAVVNALRAVFDGDANDTLIKHHAHHAQVSLDFGPENLLVWQRFRKGKVKTSYKLMDGASQEIIHATDGTKVPEWMTDTLKIGKVDGLDIQIGQQQDPVFLLNQPASTRAKALSIGQESGHVNNMMLMDRQELQEAKATLKNCEKELEQARRKLAVFAHLDPQDYQKIDADVQDGLLRVGGISHAKALLEKWSAIQKSLCVLQQPITQAPQLPVMKAPPFQQLLQRWLPFSAQVSTLQHIKDTPRSPNLPTPKQHAAQQLLQRWNDAQQYSIALQLENQIVPDTVPAHNRNDVAVLLGRWLDAHKKNLVLQEIGSNSLTPPVLSDTQQLQVAMEKWNACTNNKTALEKATQQLADDENNLIDRINTQFPLCPTCQRAWDHSGH